MKSMRRFLAAFIVLVISMTVVMAQNTEFEDAMRTQVSDTVYGWKKGGSFNFQFSQVSFVNWAAGGDNSISGLAGLDLYANKIEERTFWNNTLVVGYGMQNLKGDVTKTDDKLNFTSQYGRKIGDTKWFYSGLLDFKTQMNVGYDSEDTKISNFMSPGYMFIALGLDFQKSDNFNVFFAPLTMKSTYVLDDSLSAKGSFGLDAGETTRHELGGYIKMFFKHEIMKNITFQTKLDLFSNYMNNPQNIDVFWEVTLDLKVNSLISAQITTNLIYDDDIMIGYDSSGDGLLDSEHATTQFKELFSAGLVVDF